MRPCRIPFSHLTHKEKTMPTLLTIVVVIVVLWMVWFGLSALRYVKSGEYEIDTRIQKVSR
jgi:threonine/homoserine/homoserine lactone efflux protein